MERPSRTLMASGGNEPVADEGGSGHSVFADAFLRALKEADKGIFTAEELFHGRVKSSVAGKSDQVPEYNDIKNSGHDGGDFIFKLASIPLLPLNKGGMEGVVEPEINVKEAPKSDFSLEDLDKKAKQIEDNKAAWGNTLNKMQGAFNQVAEYQKRDIEKDLKIAAWSKFLNSFTEDNPYSSEDESMRQKARQEIEKWQKVAMATVVGDTRDTVTGMELIFVKGGCYQMGDTFGDGESDEKPMHEVCVDDFYMGKYEVTVGEFRGFVNATGYRTDAEKNTGGVNGCFAYDQDDKEKQWNWREWASWKRPNKYQENEDNHPVACISWNDAKAFIEWMGRKSGKNYRLPTEAEWEYAARGGTTGRNYWGNSKEEACRYANVADRTKLPGGSSWNDKHECDDGYAFASPVGRFQANAFGLYDMMGNVWEWCSDWYADDYYRKSPKNNPEGVNSGQSRVIRGGSW
ncbi:MAG: formylglycine-generating enzyme family protein, partial [Nitrospinae bacterium]|nr:formylglycine-generating enzyme family protein [Nitrospinota bacterium]